MLAPHLRSLHSESDLSLKVIGIPSGGFGSEESAEERSKSTAVDGNAFLRQGARRKQSPDEIALIRLCIRVRRIIDDLYGGFFGGYPTSLPRVGR